MILVDANLLLYAANHAAPEHEAASTWLDARLSATARVALPWPSLLAFVRLATNPVVMSRPASMAAAWRQVEEWLAAQPVWIPSPTEHHAEVMAGFCTAPGMNVLAPGELLDSLTFPAPRENSGSRYQRFIPRNEMDIAVVGVAASVVLDASGRRFESACIALGAVAPTPLYAEEASAALVGRPVDDETIRAAAEAARALARPIDDMRGTVDFRKHVTGVLAERVIRGAVERARHPWS